MPALDMIEREAESVGAELARILECARGVYRQLQDAEAEAEEGNVGPWFARAYIARDELRRIARQLTRAQACLVHAGDPRYGAAQKVIGYCDEADEADVFPRAVG